MTERQQDRLYGYPDDCYAATRMEAEQTETDLVLARVESRPPPKLPSVGSRGSGHPRRGRVCLPGMDVEYPSARTEHSG